MIRIMDEGAVRVSVFSGHITSEEYLRTYRTLMSAPDFDPDRDALIDLRGVTSSDLHWQHVRQVAEWFRERPATRAHRLAFVTAPGLGYGYARVYQSLQEHGLEEVRIFDELGEAREWLGLSAPDATEPPDA